MLIIRVQLIHAHNNFVSPQVFDRMFTMHGTAMIFFVAMPVLFGFANYLVPLMIGACDMAFPPAQRIQFLANCAWRATALLQFSWRQWPIWRRECT
jgi:cytochrome c oxidase subunit I